jgi:hypothetical protein
MSSKRSPQTAAKREREQAVKERRKRKLEKKQAAAAARNGTGPAIEPVEGDSPVQPGVESAPEPTGSSLSESEPPTLAAFPAQR